MKLRNKKSLIFIVLVFVVFLVLGSFAYLLSTDTFENIFSAGIYKTVTREVFQSPTNWTPGDETPKTITTKNEGTIPVRVRVKLDESWTSTNNETLSLEYNNEKVAIINLDNQNDWLYKDGYYYYIKELAPGESTKSLLKSVTFNPNIQADVVCSFSNGVNTCESTGNGYDGAAYRLNITTETVQANKYDKVWENVPIMYDYVGDNPCTFDGELIPGAEYVNGQYTYRYRQEKDYSDWINITDYGWGVALTDKESTEPVTTTLCSSINNKPIVSMNSTFRGSNSEYIDLNNFDTSNVTNMHSMFASSDFTSLDLRNFDTSKVTDMHAMFYENEATMIDISSFDTSKVTDMSEMFEGCLLTSLDLRNFDTSNVTTMYGMFAFSKMTSMDLSSFDTRKVTDMSWMFEDCLLSSIDLRNFDTSNVTNMWAMFSEIELESLDLSGFDTSSVTNMSSMFSYSSINNLDLSSFDTSSVTNMRSMFSLSNIGTLDLSSFDMTTVINTDSMFDDSAATTGYGRTQADCDKLNASSYKPSGLTFVVK